MCHNCIRKLRYVSLPRAPRLALPYGSAWGSPMWHHSSSKWYVLRAHKPLC
ncbi:hypothetical protein C1646_722107 [Rhizophagus diaphanus]|nr:hypothetical protein C1646_722107 [Rhizophagus diaphanus] [Rhizophagus sp. MUCL 43196]